MHAPLKPLAVGGESALPLSGCFRALISLPANHRRVAGGLLAAVLCCGSIKGADVASLEYGVKAAFLYNFVKFVEWPNGAFTSPDAPVAICVLGADPFGRTLDEIVQGERVESRSLVVRRVDNAASAASCHLLFVSSSERTRFEAILRAIDTRRVLTVAERMKFLGAGGHIALSRGEPRTVRGEHRRHGEIRIPGQLQAVAGRADLRLAIRPAR
jgi:hypothetical protein